VGEERREDGYIREDWAHGSVERRLLPEPRGVPLLTPTDKNIRVLWGIPMERTLNQYAFFGFAKILTQGWTLAELQYTRNDIARCKFTDYLLKDDRYTHLVMLDSDHVHPPTIIQRLARWFQAYPKQVQVVGGLNFRRGEPYDPCAFIDPGDGHFRRIAEWPRGAMEVEALGTGSIMIAREVFDTMSPPWFGYDYDNNYGDWPGTDMWFSAECRKRGITLWCDTTTTSPHIGHKLIDGTDYAQWTEENVKNATGADPTRKPISLGI